MKKVILSKKCPLSFGLGSPLLSMKQRIKREVEPIMEIFSFAVA